MFDVLSLFALMSLTASMLMSADINRYRCGCCVCVCSSEKSELIYFFVAEVVGTARALVAAIVVLTNFFRGDYLFP